MATTSPKARTPLDLGNQRIPLSPRPSRRRFLRLSTLAVAAAGGTLGLAACSSGDGAGASATPVDGGTLRFGVETEPTTLNPQLAAQDAVRPLLRNVFDSYLYKDGDGEYHPWLAQDWSVSEDGLTVTLTLAQGITFSDGAALDAAAVVANFEKFTDPAYTATSRVARTSLAAWEATDERTVTFTLSQPDVLFLDYLASLGSTPLSPDSLEADSVRSGGPALAGTGPFTITAYQQGSSLSLACRKDYAWAPEALTGRQGAAHLDGIEVSFLPEAATRTGALQSGQVDIIDGVPAQNVASLDGVGGISYEEVLNAGTPYTLYLNVSKAPFDDLRVRQAFQHAVDLSAIVENIYYGTAQRAWSAISPTSPFYDEALTDTSITFDADAANALLDEAGWTGRDSAGFRTKDGRRLTARLVSGAPYVRDSRDTLNLAISDAMKQNVAVEYLFQPVDSGTEDERADANDYEVFDNTYNASDVATSLDLLYNSDPAKGVIARGRYDDAQLDDWLNTARGTTDTAQRQGIYTRFQTYVVDTQAYTVPLYVPRNSVAYGSTVHGVLTDPGSGTTFSAYNVWLEQ